MTIIILKTRKHTAKYRFFLTDTLTGESYDLKTNPLNQNHNHNILSIV